MPEDRAKIGKVLREFRLGTLKSSSGEPVTERKQAIAIALSEAGQSRKSKTAQQKAAEQP